MSRCPHCRTELLSIADAARLAGVQPSTWATYVSRGYAPEPALRVGSAPAWTRAQVEQWLASRPGQGAGGGRPRKAG